jgi:hypothetical protein
MLGFGAAFLLAAAGGVAAIVNPISISNESASKVTTDGSTATASFTFRTDRKVVDQDGSSLDTSWISSGYNLGDYSIRVTVNSGTTPTGTIGSWLALSSNRTWSLSQSSGASGTKTCSLKVEIKENASGTILDTATYTLTADSQAATPTTTYSPAAGTYSATDYDYVEIGVSASASVPWTYSYTGSAPGASLLSGASGVAISFSLSAGTTDKSSTITLQSGGNTWTLNLTAWTTYDPNPCVTTDTLILADPTGKQVPAGSIVAGDEIYTQHETTMEWGMFRVLSNVIVPDQDVLAIELNGKRLRATPEHRFCVDSEWRTITELGGVPDGKAAVCKMTVEHAHTYVSNGQLSHNIKLPEN